MRRVATAVLIALSPAACGTARRPGFPRQSYDEDEQIKQLERVFEKPEMIADYYDPAKTPEAGRRDARDRIISGRLALIDLNYNEFVRQFASNKQAIDTTAEITAIGLNLATAAVGGAEAKTVLGAVAGGVTASKVAIDKNFFYERTVPVLVSAMNAERKQALIPITNGLGQPPEQYTLGQGLSDLDTYYFAGTFLGALQTIQADAGAKEVQAELELTTVRERRFFGKERQDRAAELVDAVDTLSNAQAIALATNPPFSNPEADKMVAAIDPGGKRLRDGGAARRVLKARIPYAKRSEAELDAWETAVRAAK